MSAEFCVTVLFTLGAFVVFVCLAVVEARERLHEWDHVHEESTEDIRRAA